MEKKSSLHINTAVLQPTNHILQLDALAIPARAELVYVTDAEWIEACKRGERVAQKWLYEKYASKMYYVCLRYLGEKDDAEDAMHDAFVKVFGSINKFRGDAAITTWITRIMVNTSINVIRKVTRQGIKKDIDKIQLVAEDTQDMLVDAPATLSAQHVLQMITELPLGYRTVLSMYALDGFTHKEIAKALKISEGTSKSQLAKARRMLKSRIEEENE